jgi:hypothetical protein
MTYKLGDKVIMIDVSKVCLRGRVGTINSNQSPYIDTVSVLVEQGGTKSIKNWFPYRLKKYEESKWPY